MLILVLVAFVAGLVTVLSPCILPVLPIVLGSSINGGKARPLGVVIGLIVSFSIFTLAAAQIVALLHLSPDVLRDLAIVIIAVLGISLIIPAFNQWMERLFSRLPGLASTQQRSGLLGGLLTGASLGLVWAPCAGPILAAVTALAATQKVSAGTVAVIIAYSIGAAIPMFGIAYGGRALVQRSRRFVRYGGRLQQVFGVLMVGTAVLMIFNLDVQFTVWATTSLAPQWTNTLQSIEQVDAVKSQLDVLAGRTPVPTAAPQIQVNIFTGATAVPTGATQNENVAAVSGPADASGPQAADFAGISHWINSDPLTMAGLRGKVVLVDFWTYSCINCLRTLPYVTSWYSKYKDQGFVVVGVHTPEFEFEHDTGNVEAAVQRLGITYPVAQDNDYATWNAFNNEYWPADYLIDARGEIRYTAFGEGDYDKTEEAIQQLLAENGKTVNAALTTGPVAQFSADETPETYIGTDRQSGFASPEVVRADQVAQYTLPTALPANDFAVSGSWNFGGEFATVAAPNATLSLHFNAKNVYLVMTSDKPVPVDVKLVSPNQANQSPDVDKSGQITVSASRLYQLVQLDSAQEGTVEVNFTQPGVQAYSFTFGD